jgi:hypothetical protein
MGHFGDKCYTSVVLCFPFIFCYLLILALPGASLGNSSWSMLVGRSKTVQVVNLGQIVSC